MTKNVYQLIADVSAEIAKTGISKDRNNAQQGYKFRGIDDVYNSLAPIISKSGLVILPRMESREVAERSTSKGNAIFYVTVDAEFDFVSSHDGSKHVVKIFGEAMDTADKATNKAMSAAYKYAVFQTFCIPTEGDNDADQTTHEAVTSALPWLIPDMPEWERAKTYYLRDGNLKFVLTRFRMSSANQEKLITECTQEDIPQ